MHVELICFLGIRQELRHFWHFSRQCEEQPAFPAEPGFNLWTIRFVWISCLPLLECLCADFAKPSNPRLHKSSYQNTKANIYYPCVRRKTLNKATPQLKTQSDECRKAEEISNRNYFWHFNKQLQATGNYSNMFCSRYLSIFKCFKYSFISVLYLVSYA